MNIAVLCGGVSSEREISLRSSVKVSKALESKGHDCIMIDVFFGEDKEPVFGNKQDFEKTADILRAKNSLITKELIEKTGITGPNVLNVCKKADIVFLGLHGVNGEDGKIQSLLDENGIKYTGSGAEGSAIAMSKAKTKQVMAEYVRMPKGIIINKEETPYPVMDVPCVLKPSNGGSSVGVMIVKTADEYAGALEKCFEYDDTVLAEEYIDGRELTQAVLNCRALPPVEICPEEGKWYDYTNKYSGFTREVCPAQIPEDVLREMSGISLEFGRRLGLSVYYRIDYLLDKDGRLYALEANTLPGMTNTSLVPQEAAAVGISYEDLCDNIINISLNKYSEGEK